MLNKLLIVLFVSVLLVGCNNNMVINIEDISIDIEMENNSIEDIEEDIIVNDVSNLAMNRGNVLAIGIPEIDGIFNPIFYKSEYDKKICDIVFNGLVKNNDKKEIVPDLANWEISKDKRTYIFYLKKDIEFQNGDKLTSEDIKFTYYTIASSDYDGIYGSVMDDIVGIENYRNKKTDYIKGIKVIDEYTISFTISKANVLKINEMNVGILNHNYYSFETIEDLKLLNNQPMGTGPMSFDEIKYKDYIKFTAFDNYFEGRTNIDGIIYKIVPEAKMSMAIDDGDIDIGKVPSDLKNYKIVKESNIGNLQEYLDNSYRYIGFNLRLPEFKDKKVRQALAYGLNVSEFIDVQWGGFATQCLTSVSPAAWEYPDETLLTNYSYDPEKATELLKEAGWSDTDGDGFLDKKGERFTITWTTYNEAEWPSNLISVAKKNWGDLGVELKVDVMEFESVLDLVYEKHEFDIYNMAWSLDSNVSQKMMFSKSADVLGGYNSVGFYNRRADEIFRLADKEYDPLERTVLYQELAQIVNEELPYIFLSIGNVIEGVNNRVHNLELDTFKSVESQLLNIELDYLD